MRLTQLHTLIFINLGSLLPLPSTVPLPPYCKLHVIDSHRPWNLENLFATSQINDQICVWDDGEIEARLSKEKEAYEMLEFDLESDSDASDSDSDSDADADDGTDGAASDADALSDDAAPGADATPDADASLDAAAPDALAPSDAGGPTPPRRRPRQDEHLPRQAKRSRLDRDQRDVYRAVLAKYYARGSWTGMSTAQMMYMLAVALGRASHDDLWYAILGLTAQYISSAIHAGTYEKYAAAFASDAVAMSMNDDAEHSAVHGADDASVRVVPEELRFTLYRHWSLEMSMYHTSYVAAKLGIWREKGIHKLRGLLAKMGLSLANCRQSYEHMELDLRQSLVQRMAAIAPEYGLEDLTYRSFTRSYGFRSMPLSAADAVEGIAALLQAAHGVRIEVEGVQVIRTDTARAGLRATEPATTSYGGKTLWSLGRDDSARRHPDPPAAADADPDVPAPAPGQRQLTSAAWVKNFFEAYRAMDVQRPASVPLLLSSLSLAKALHQAIVAQGVSVIVKQSIKTLRSFRLAVLQDGPSLHLFVHPDTLTRLGLWLIDALRDIVAEQHTRRAEAKRARRRSKGADESDTSEALPHLPFVLAALDAPRDVYVVVGIVGAPDFGDASRNQFGLAFQEAAHASGAHMQTDRFDSSVLEVKRDDLMPFVESLHLRT